ncbi:DUF3857 domain-containing protein [Sphingobacterium paludis]|uniref:Transglutaminase-like putative cysteine protease n=1 Tax=Sphingobacterium paludis TaxID=1476465 RepID=A0A4R7D0X9_9SPHI|nr:DUF3857 domain-containing protein [Sphingobacterium paludis]TDS12436.1 transglutaminase-like putative cysteine protease [Sphingobacterium paludis]
MKYIVISFLACCLHTVTAQTIYDIQKIPKELKARAAATIRDESINIEMRSENDVVEKVKRAITVHNKSGDYYAAIPLYYNKSAAIKSIKGAVYNEFGIAIQKIAPKNFVDISAVDGFSMFSDTRLKLYQFEAIQYPYTVEIEYEVQHKQNLSIPSWQPNFSPNIAVQNSTYTFAAPSDVAIRSHVQNAAAEPQVERKDKLTLRTWKVSNIPAVKEEPFTKNFRDESIEVFIVPEKVSYYGKTGAFNTWKEFGKWKYDNLLQGKQNLNTAVRDKVIALTKDCVTDKDKAKVLYRYLQEKTRYVSIQVGIGGLEPFPASDVEKYGYGDCKALVNYMQNLLSFVDIPSYYCVVQAGNKKEDLRLDFANARDGNHIILCIPFENDTTWLECTSQQMPFGFLGDFTDDRLVLACTAEGGQVLRTPHYAEAQNSQVRRAKLKLHNFTDLEGTIETTFSGTQYDNHIDVFRSNNAEKPKLLAKHYDINNIRFENIAYTKLEDGVMPGIREAIGIQIPGIVTKAGQKIIIPSTLFNNYPTIPRNDSRQQPIYINRGFTDEDLVEIQLPADVKQLTIPLEKSFACEIGSYMFTAHMEGDTLVSSRKLTIKQGIYDASKYAEFHDFLRSVSQTDKGRFTLEIRQ